MSAPDGAAGERKAQDLTQVSPRQGQLHGHVICAVLQDTELGDAMLGLMLYFHLDILNSFILYFVNKVQWDNAACVWTEGMCEYACLLFPDSIHVSICEHRIPLEP